MAKYHLGILVTALFAASMLVFAYKVAVLNFPVVPDTVSSLWNVEASVSFRARPEKGVKVSLLIPRGDSSTLIMDENFISRGFGLSTGQVGFNRKATWAVRNASGLQKLYYRAVVRKLGKGEGGGVALPPARSPERKLEGAQLEAATAVIDEVRQHSADVETFVRQLLHVINEQPANDNLRLLLGKKPNKQSKLRLAAELLREAGISARTAHGIRLHEEMRDVPLEHWLEIYEGGRWSVFARGGNSGEDDGPYLIWSRGDDPLTEIIGGAGLQLRLSVARSQEEAIESALVQTQNRYRAFLDFSLFSLPIQAQAVYKILLTIPVGALVIVVLRSLVGIRTFGTFMPVLVALAFRETKLLNGILLFVFIVSLGLAVRLYFEHLKLLLVPRLCAVLTVVILTMVMLGIVTYRLGIETGLSIALFPVVILTMTIERMSILWEEVGAPAAIKQGVGTLLAAAVTYTVMSVSFVEHLMFVFPELALSVLAITILLGRYTGYRLLELGRFKALISEGL